MNREGNTGYFLLRQLHNDEAVTIAVHTEDELHRDRLQVKPLAQVQFEGAPRPDLLTLDADEPHGARPVAHTIGEHQIDEDLQAKSAHSTDDDAPEEKPDERNPAAVELGRLGGKKGGRARADKLTPEERSEIAKKAAAARWARVTLSH